MNFNFTKQFIAFVGVFLVGFGMSGQITDVNGNIGIGRNTPNAKLDVAGTTRIMTTLDILANGNNDFVASKVLLKSHDDYRGAGIFSLGQTNNWFFGNPYTDHADSFMIGVGAKSEGEKQIAQKKFAKLYINSNGNVGIGSANPNTKLEVSDSSTPTFRLSNTNTAAEKGSLAGKIDFFKKDPSYGEGVVSSISSRAVDLGGSYALDFATGDAGGNVNAIETRMTINHKGDVGIGTSNPTQKLVVKGTTVVGDGNWGALIVDGKGKNDWLFNSHSNGQYFILRTQGDDDTSWSKNVMTINRSSGNVGIGVTPTSKFHVAGQIRAESDYIISGTARLAKKDTNSAHLWAIGDLELGANGPKTHMMISKETGGVGIGTTNPGAKLHISDDSNNTSRAIIDLGSASNNTGLLMKSSNISKGSYWIKTEGNDVEDSFVVRGNGNVGIGTDNDYPDYKLSVNGKIQAKEIKVHTGWADFVFFNDYKLPTLAEVESHIADKGHLKDIPSAKEVAENGIFLGDMNAKLLQKIEELTLYTIQQEKKIEALEVKNTELKALSSQLLEVTKRLEKLEK